MARKPLSTTATAGAVASETITNEKESIITTETVDGPEAVSEHLTAVEQHAKLAAEREQAFRDARAALAAAEEAKEQAEEALLEYGTGAGNGSLEERAKKALELEKVVDLAAADIKAAEAALTAADRRRLNTDVRVAEALAPHLRKALPKGLEVRVLGFVPQAPSPEELPVAYLVQQAPSVVHDTGTLSSGRFDAGRFRSIKKLELHVFGKGRHYVPTGEEVTEAFPIEVKLHSTGQGAYVEAKRPQYDRDKDFRKAVFTFDVEHCVPELPILARVPDEHCLKFLLDEVQEYVEGQGKSGYSATVRTRTEGDKLTTTVEATLAFGASRGLLERLGQGEPYVKVGQWITNTLSKWGGHGVAGLGHVASITVDSSRPWHRDGAEGAALQVTVEAVALLGDPNLPRESISHTDDQDYIEIPVGGGVGTNGVHYAPELRKVHRDSAQALRFLEQEAARLDAKAVGEANPERQAKVLSGAAMEPHPGKVI